MFRFALIMLMSLTVTSHAGAAVKWNNSGSEGQTTTVSKEVKKIADDFEFVELGQVAVNSRTRKSSLSAEDLKNRCGYRSIFTPKVISDVKAPNGYGLDNRFISVAYFFREAAARCLGGSNSMCKEIHNHALDYASNSKINKPRGSSKDVVFWGDTLTVSMRLIVPMASALGVAWNEGNFPQNEKKAIMTWLHKIGNSFEHGMRNDGSYDQSRYGFTAKRAGQNHAVQSSIAQMSIAALTGSKDKFLTGVEQWFITLDTMRKDGSLPAETMRGARAMFYHGRTLSGLFAIAKRAEVQGVDLLGIERKKNIHKAVGFYLDVAENPDLILKYAKKNKAPGPIKNYKFQDLSGASSFIKSGHGWVRLYIERFPEHKNTKRLLNLNAKNSHISKSLSESVKQRGKSTEWITSNTECFYTSD